MAIRARDLRANISAMGFEKGVNHTLELLLEEHAQLRQHFRELTELTSQCIDEVNKMVHIGSSLRNTIEQLKRDQQGDTNGEHSKLPPSN